MQAMYPPSGPTAPSASVTPFTLVGGALHRQHRPIKPAARGRIDLLRISLFLVVFLSIGRMHQHYAFLAAFRPALVLVGLATALALLQPKYLNHAPLLGTWPARIVAAIGAMA